MKITLTRTLRHILAATQVFIVCRNALFNTSGRGNEGLLICCFLDFVCAFNVFVIMPFQNWTLTHSLPSTTTTCLCPPMPLHSSHLSPNIHSLPLNPSYSSVSLFAVTTSYHCLNNFLYHLLHSAIHSFSHCFLLNSENGHQCTHHHHHYFFIPILHKDWPATRHGFFSESHFSHL